MWAITSKFYSFKNMTAAIQPWFLDKHIWDKQRELCPYGKTWKFIIIVLHWLTLFQNDIP